MIKRGEYKAQVTIFIIVALIILVILILGFLAYKSNLLTFNSNKISPEISFVNDEISECINQRGIDALGIIGLQGGYIILPSKYIKTEIANVAFGLSNRRNILISLEDIEKQIESYLEITTPLCVNKLNESSEEFDIKSEKPTAKVIIDEQVIISVTLPISIKKGDKTFYLKNPYVYSIDIRLKKIHETAEKVIEKQLKNQDYIDLTFLSNLEPHTTFILVDDKIGLYVITDEQSIIDDIEYSYMFGVELL